jgi:hypothetical protein
LSQVLNNIFKNIPLLYASGPVGPSSGRTSDVIVKQLHNNVLSVVYADLLLVIRVALCYTGSSIFRQRVHDMAMLTVHLLDNIKHQITMHGMVNIKRTTQFVVVFTTAGHFSVSFPGE